MGEYFSRKNVANCQIWYFEKLQTNQKGTNLYQASAYFLM